MKTFEETHATRTSLQDSVFSLANSYIGFYGFVWGILAIFPQLQHDFKAWHLDEILRSVLNVLVVLAFLVALLLAILLQKWETKRLVIDSGKVELSTTWHWTCCGCCEFFVVSQHQVLFNDLKAVKGLVLNHAVPKKKYTLVQAFLDYCPVLNLVKWLPEKIYEYNFGSFDDATVLYTEEKDAWELRLQPLLLLFPLLGVYNKDFWSLLLLAGEIFNMLSHLIRAQMAKENNLILSCNIVAEKKTFNRNIEVTFSSREDLCQAAAMLLVLKNGKAMDDQQKFETRQGTLTISSVATSHCKEEWLWWMPKFLVVMDDQIRFHDDVDKVVKSGSCFGGTVIRVHTADELTIPVRCHADGLAIQDGMVAPVHRRHFGAQAHDDPHTELVEWRVAGCCASCKYILTESCIQCERRFCFGSETTSIFYHGLQTIYAHLKTTCCKGLRATVRLDERADFSFEVDSEDYQEVVETIGKKAGVQVSVEDLEAAEYEGESWFERLSRALQVILLCSKFPEELEGFTSSVTDLFGALKDIDFEDPEQALNVIANEDFKMDYEGLAEGIDKMSTALANANSPFSSRRLIPQ